MYSRSPAKGMIIVYDGECPFCASYVRLMALKKQVGAVELVDARSDHHSVRQLQGRGYDLDEGMAVIFGDAVYYGPDAVVLISELTEDGGWHQRLLSGLLRNPARARRLYPALKLGRRIALRLLGKPGISPLRTSGGE